MVCLYWLLEWTILTLDVALGYKHFSLYETSTLPHACLQVLLRALRDFNAGKLTTDDTSIFMGLLNDLFPKTLDLVPRADDHAFDSKVQIQHVILPSLHTTEYGSL